MTLANGSLWEKWLRFRRRPVADRQLILRAFVDLQVTAIGLRWFGFQRWRELIERCSRPADGRHPLPDDSQRKMALRVARAVNSAALHGPADPKCLERSLTLWWMLRREGIAGKLQVGGRKKAGEFEAHAWVEWDGQVLNDAADVREHFAQFDAPIASPADSHDSRKADAL